jgi:hypothetical protein
MHVIAPTITLYSQINANSNQVGGVCGPGLNFWMRLSTPYVWQNGEILQVTTVIYDSFLVQYGMKSTSPFRVDTVKSAWKLQFEVLGHQILTQKSFRAAHPGR